MSGGLSGGFQYGVRNVKCQKVIRKVGECFMGCHIILGRCKNVSGRCHMVLGRSRKVS